MLLEKIVEFFGFILFVGCALYFFGSVIRAPLQVHWENSKKLEDTSLGEFISQAIFGGIHFFRNSVNRTAFLISAALVAVLWFIGTTFYVAFFFGSLCYLFSGLLFPKSVMSPLKTAAQDANLDSTKKTTDS